MSSYEVASLSNVQSLSTTVLKDVINLSNLGLIAVLFCNELAYLYAQ